MAVYRVTRLFADFSGNLGFTAGSGGTQNFPSGFGFNSSGSGVNINAINNSKNIADVPKNLGDVPSQIFKLPVIKNEEAIKSTTKGGTGIGIGEKIAETWKSWGKQGTAGTIKKAGVIGAGVLGAGLLAKGLLGGGPGKPQQEEFSEGEEETTKVRIRVLQGNGVIDGRDLYEVSRNLMKESRSPKVRLARTVTKNLR